MDVTDWMPRAEGLISVNLSAVRINENGKNEYEWERDKRQERPDLNLHCRDEILGLLPSLLFVFYYWSLSGGVLAYYLFVHVLTHTRLQT